MSDVLDTPGAGTPDLTDSGLAELAAGMPELDIDPGLGDDLDLAEDAAIPAPGLEVTPDGGNPLPDSGEAG